MIFSAYGSGIRVNSYQAGKIGRTDGDLGKIMDELFLEILFEADLRNCFSESEALLEGTDRSW